MKKTQKPVLTISLLVSNRIDTIKKCMESIRPLLEQVPSELIVVDTVGEENSDGSLAIAREYTDKIIPFDWCPLPAQCRQAWQALSHPDRSNLTWNEPIGRVNCIR